MEIFFLTLFINLCSTGLAYYNDDNNDSSISSSRIPYIIISVIIGFIIFVIIFILCKAKFSNRHRMSILPLSSQINLVQQENQYAPPPYNQIPPYGQPPPYEQPPPYIAPSAPIESTKITNNSI